jgi:hypothetical protein
MKNIQVLPTSIEKIDRKTQVIWLTKENQLLHTHSSSHDLIPQNIYITSKEKIKEGDWCINIYRNKNEIFKNINLESTEFVKKIILTTNQDLIKDGVQAIDDEFLEWFVKNPSCEEIKINYGQEPCINCDWNHDMCPHAEECLKNIYKIIIPKEEPKLKMSITRSKKKQNDT